MRAGRDLQAGKRRQLLLCILLFHAVFPQLVDDAAHTVCLPYNAWLMLTCLFCAALFTSHILEYCRHWPTFGESNDKNLGHLVNGLNATKNTDTEKCVGT